MIKPIPFSFKCVGMLVHCSSLIFPVGTKNGNETMFIPPLCRLNLLMPQNHWTEKENSVHHKNKLGQHKCIKTCAKCCYFVNNTPD